MIKYRYTDQLIASKWWEGPARLILSEDESITATKEEDIEQEERKTIVIVVIKTEEAFVQSRIYKYFSKYIHIIRLVDWIC